MSNMLLTFYSFLIIISIIKYYSAVSSADTIMEGNCLRISAKGRYALAATISMARDYRRDECTAIITISEKLGISKIYLEQVFALLKRGGIVNSVKGAGGGYQLCRMPEKISVQDVLSAVETSLFEDAEETVAKSAPEIDKVMRRFAFDPLDKAVGDALGNISLADMVAELEKYKSDGGYMYYI